MLSALYNFIINSNSVLECNQYICDINSWKGQALAMWDRLCHNEPVWLEIVDSCFSLYWASSWTYFCGISQFARCTVLTRPNNGRNSCPWFLDELTHYFRVKVVKGLTAVFFTHLYIEARNLSFMHALICDIVCKQIDLLSFVCKLPNSQSPESSVFMSKCQLIYMTNDLNSRVVWVG